jgi:hypothetical protein
MPGAGSRATKLGFSILMVGPELEDPGDPDVESEYAVTMSDLLGTGKPQTC